MKMRLPEGISLRFWEPTLDLKRGSAKNRKSNLVFIADDTFTFLMIPKLGDHSFFG
jgi:hypothetical protein